MSGGTMLSVDDILATLADRSGRNLAISPRSLV
jgi:hypothetical protein